MVRFSKFTPEKEIYDKFEGFLFKLIWREPLFVVGPIVLGYKKLVASNVLQILFFLRKTFYRFNYMICK